MKLLDRSKAQASSAQVLDQAGPQVHRSATLKVRYFASPIFRLSGFDCRF